ncbi:DNA cytosine methyltransferase [Pseudonocardia sp. RS11V-5]|uniref:DNA cytosine methyltransferase n=1 Tax=Pseudonocardia terrae TaxID=2905831 RepID=UPI001E4BB297|nr:DNA cytosine methyltransferase [Pseudonocardia terrae]MCE3551335.1 DNA cytosine methyltransferase [Pseudonocardia terrae]
MTKAPTLIDLFAGCGGMTAGFTRHGFNPVLAVEHDLHAAATYAANYGEDHIHWGDIAEVADDDIPDADVVIGGPPCQGFSNLGSKDVNDPRNQLWKQYLRFVQIARPQVFVIENVDRFHKSAEFQLLRDEADHGMIEDYELTHGLLLAADYGVPQRRTRTIIIGSRVGRIPHPEPTHSKFPTLSGTQPWRTVRDAISALPERPDTTELPDTKTDYFGRVVPGEFKWLDLHFGRKPREQSLLRYDCIPPGGGRFDLPDELLPRCWREKKTGTTDVMGRMRWDHPSLTIRTEFFKPEKGQYLHPQWEADRPERRVNRVITHLEAALLQEFPETFAWCGSKIQIAKQIGNAVPVGLAAAIARHVQSYLQ